MATEHDPQNAHHADEPTAQPPPAAPHMHHGTHGAAVSTAALATHATLHCLLGCGVGELAGLAIGVSLGFDPWATMALATALGFLTGYLFGLWPLVRRGMGWLGAFRLIWLGETVSIAVMEFTMNFVDYRIGGVHAATVMSGQFWIAFVLALPAGFLAAWPVNYWLLRRNPQQGVSTL